MPPTEVQTSVQSGRSLVVLLLLAAPLPILAAGPIDTCVDSGVPRTGLQDCLDRRLQDAEAALEKAAMAVHGRMADIERNTGRSQAAGTFEDSERAFREYLERHCEWVGTTAAGEGARATVTDCRIRLTEQHTAELQSTARPTGKPPIAGLSLVPSQKPARAGAIPAGEWQLVSLEHAGQRVTLPEDSRATLSFDRNGMAAGRAFVNRYFGNAGITESGRLAWSGALGSTRMMGPAELMDAEQQYLKALERVDHWRVDGGTLVLESRDNAVTLRYAR